MIRALFLALAFAVAGTIAAKAQEPVVLRTIDDSTNYMLGLSLGKQSLEDLFFGSEDAQLILDIDTFLVGIRYGIEHRVTINDKALMAELEVLDTGLANMNTASRVLGTFYGKQMFGRTMDQIGLKPNVDLLLQGIRDARAGHALLDSTAETIVREYMRATFESRMRAYIDSLRNVYNANLPAARRFVAERAKQKGVKQIGNGVLREVLVKGRGMVVGRERKGPTRVGDAVIDGEYMVSLRYGITDYHGTPQRLVSETSDAWTIPEPDRPEQPKPTLLDSTTAVMELTRSSMSPALWAAIRDLPAGSTIRLTIPPLDEAELGDDNTTLAPLLALDAQEGSALVYTIEIVRVR